MALKTFDLGQLAEIDGGRIAAALELEMKQAIHDCRDRPTESAARKVVLQVELKPTVYDGTGDLETINMTFQCKHTIPTRKSRSYNVGVKKNGSLVYSEYAPDNVHQRTLDEMEGDE